MVKGEDKTGEQEKLKILKINKSDLKKKAEGWKREKGKRWYSERGKKWEN